MPASTPGHRPRKRFGQNFLHDENIIRKIVNAIEFDDELPVVEIGPGKGALTRELLELKSPVHAIEIDRDLASHLESSLAEFEHFHLYRDDALKFDFKRIHPQPLQVIGNLPYNVSTPLLFHLLRYLPVIKSMLFMLQDEVVERICANEGSPDYGRLSVMIQSRCQVQKLFEVPATAFTPVPRVTSAIVMLQPEPETQKQILDFSLFEVVVRQAFSQRRKTIRRSLQGLLSKLEIESLGFSSDIRPGELSVNDFVKLANFASDKSRSTGQAVDKSGD